MVVYVYETVFAIYKIQDTFAVAYIYFNKHSITLQGVLVKSCHFLLNVKCMVSNKKLPHFLKKG